MGIHIAGLYTAGRDELLQHWRTLIRRPPPKHISRALLIQILAFEIQTELYGGYSKRLSQRLTRASLREVVSDGCEPVSAKTVRLILMPRRVYATRQERRRG